MRTYGRPSRVVPEISRSLVALYPVRFADPHLGQVLGKTSTSGGGERFPFAFGPATAVFLITFSFFGFRLVILCNLKFEI